MAKIRFANGITVNFDGDPTEQDIEEVSKSLEISQPEAGFPERAVSGTIGMAKEMAQFPVTFPTKQPFTGLEEAGEKVSEAVSGSAEKMAEEGYPATATVSGMLGEFGKLTPSNIIMSLGAEASPAIIGKVIDKLPKSIVNRFIKAPKHIAEGRLMKGQQTVGEDFLANKILNPRGFGELPSGDKEEIYKTTLEQIGQLGNKVRNRISEMKMPQSIKTSEVADSIDPLINEVKSSFGETSRQVRQLERFKKDFMSGKPEYLSFQEANDLRETLGSSIGKRFEKPTGELPELVYAQKKMFSKLRDTIGQISPEIDNALKEQHIFYDIQHSVAPEVARGYGKLEFGITDIAEAPFESPKVASMIESLPKTRGIGLMPPTYQTTKNENR